MPESFNLANRMSLVDRVYYAFNSIMSISTEMMQAEETTAEKSKIFLRS